MTSTSVDQAVQITGALLVLVAYLAVQAHALPPHSLTLLVLNTVGSLALAVVAARGEQWGFLLLETVWAIASIVGLARRAARAPATQPQRGA